MKTRIKKIIIAAAALLFVSSGVSFAHDWNHKPHGRSIDHYKAKKHHHGWSHKHHKPKIIFKFKNSTINLHLMV